jgi:hypothetical protein
VTGADDDDVALAAFRVVTRQRASMPMIVRCSTRKSKSAARWLKLSIAARSVSGLSGSTFDPPLPVSVAMAPHVQLLSVAGGFVHWYATAPNRNVDSIVPSGAKSSTRRSGGRWVTVSCTSLPAESLVM